MKKTILLFTLLSSTLLAQTFPVSGWMAGDPKSYVAGNYLYFSCDSSIKTKELICDFIDVMIKKENDTCLFSFRKSTALHFPIIASNNWGMPVREGLCTNNTMMMEYFPGKNPSWKFTSEVKLSTKLMKQNSFVCKDFSKDDLTEIYSTAISPERNDCKRIKMVGPYLASDMKIGKEVFQSDF